MSGIFVEGVIKGYYEKQNGNYLNRSLAVVTGTYEGRYGDTQENIEELEIWDKTAQFAKQFAQENQGKNVRIEVRINHRHGVKNGNSWGFYKFIPVSNEGFQVLK